MKTAYLGKVQLSDTDMPYLNEAQKIGDVTYIVEINPRFMQGPAYNIKALYPHTGIFPAIKAYPELARYGSFIDTSKFYVANTTGKLWALKSLWTYLLLLIFLVRHKFDVIHIAWPPNVYEFILYLLRKKMVLTVHDPFVHTGLDTFVVRLRRKIAFRLIPKLIIFNKTQRQAFLDYYHLKPEHVENATMGCCTLLRTVEPDTDGIPGKGEYILFSGKISPYKGLDYLLPAMKEVHEKCPDCRLIVAGGGEYHFDISPYMELPYMEIRNRFIPERELVALISNARFIVCPYTDATQSGVIMSAFAFFKPAIATNVGALPEMVKDKRYGLIIKEKDTHAVASAIIALWTDPERLEHFSRNIKEDYTTGAMSWKSTAEHIKSIYSSLCD
jgi:glycosyltransferase involved in cell wall biosynthesis